MNNTENAKRIRLILLLVTVFSFTIFSTYFIHNSYFIKLGAIESKNLNYLKGITLSLAANIDGDQHLSIEENHPKKNEIIDSYADKGYLEIHEMLKKTVRVDNHISNLYTIVLKEGEIDKYRKDAAYIIVTSADKPEFRKDITPSKIFIKNYKTGGMISALSNKDGNRISAFAPIKDSEGNVVAALQADLRFDEILSVAHSEALTDMIGSIIIAIMVIATLVILIYVLTRKIISEQNMVADRFFKFDQTYSTVTAFIDKVAKGDIFAKIDLDDENKDLRTSLIGMQASLQKAEEENNRRKLEEERQNWSTKGQALFADLLRQENDNIGNFAFNIVSNLVKYLEANQGGMFVLNDSIKDNPYFEMHGAYAYGRQKHSEKRLEWGEGLIGTCALEQESIYMKKIPQGYIEITSGLGDADPNNLLIVPLKINDIVYGVIEIASFKEIETYQIEFVEKVAESIASTIATVRINLRTNELLSQTQEQAEAMKSQEEEMRQNMEEMIATQEEMSRKEAELLAKVDEMEKHKHKIEKSAEEKLLGMASELNLTKAEIERMKKLL